MRVKRMKFSRGAAAVLVLGGILWSIAPGQILQITEFGSEMVAPTRLALATTTPPVTAATVREAKVARGLFCAGSM